MKIDHQLRNFLITTAFGVCLYVGLTHLDIILNSISSFASLLQPIIIAGILAFAINVPMTKIEHVLNKVQKKRSMRGIALLIALVIILTLLGILFGYVLPQLFISVSQSIQQVINSIPEFEKVLRQHGLDESFLTTVLQYVKSTNILNTLQSTLLGSTGTFINTLSGTFGVFANVFMAIIFCIYFLLGKEMLSAHVKWFLEKLLPMKYCSKIYKGASLLQKTYTSFFTGQCLEACILSAMMFVGFTVARLPYAGLIAFCSAITSFIPIIGGLLSCAIGAILILMINPWQALLSIVVYQVIQFIENQFIYPKVVGNAVGLPAMYTILAVFIGGALYGVVGMLFFIPLVATIYTYLKGVKQNETNGAE